ncbi:MAG: outer membrane beta-barrel protein [candidate division NC10 bacterium]|nr:outer membrane beta-barrel protein [candidate division NC10 bacterium]
MRGWRVALVLVLAMMGLSGVARAEPYVAAYLGATFPLDAERSQTGPPAASASGITVDESAVFGGKIGFWSDPIPWLGIELDISGYTADIPQQVAPGLTVIATEMDITAIGFHFMGRIPLGPPEGDPFRRAYFYLGGGPAIFAVSGERGGVSQDVAEFGVHALAGFKLFLTPNIAVFAEYKFIFTEVTFDTTAGTEDNDLKINQVYGGIAYHFSFF